MQTIYWFALQMLFILKWNNGVDCASISNLTAANRIVNGNDADITSFSYQLSLRRNTIHICGASVLSAQWAISASHCIYGYEKTPKIFSLRAGSNMRLSGGAVIYVSAIFKHPSYNAETMNYDVALLRTEPNILRGDFIRPIRLPKVDANVPENTKAIVSGWGHMSSADNILSKVLKYAFVYTENAEVCNKSLIDHGGITDAMFCAAARNTDACQGDSGGPIQVNNTLIGIVSWGVGCADPFYPGVYTRLNYPGIRLWIRLISHL